ncbi:flagellar hook-basal body complex protein [Tepidibacillus sp. LV47]|uniref:flagellar hook-basal body complex protein n=1 Tax=Tepidibacillus sp. LV47 TaxID=3398228 RepID=UPI003AAB69C2
MLRSLYSGISGMKGFQVKLDVISNNIANVNTVGFKAGRVMFQDILSQKIGGAMQPIAGQRGGMNPKQVGLGSMVGSIDTLHTPGSFQTTNVLTDLAIDGDGFFQVLDAPNNTTYFTRAGNFTLDDNGYLVTPQGYYVQGVVVDNTGKAIIDANGNTIPTNIQIPEEAYDTNASKQMEKVVAYNIASDGGIDLTLANGSVIKLAKDPTSTNPTEFVKVGLVKITNPGGLEKAGNSLYIETLNAQADDINVPTELGTSIRTGTLEMSNVDLTNEFSEMIVAQRGFQANTRIITTSDEILQELVNLKR